MTRVQIIIFYTLCNTCVGIRQRSTLLSELGTLALCGLHLCASSKRFTSPYYVHRYFKYNTKRKLGKKSFCGPVCFLNNSTRE